MWLFWKWAWPHQQTTLATWAHQQNTQSNIGQQHRPINTTQSNIGQQHGPINRTLGATWTSNMGPSTEHSEQHRPATWAHQQNSEQHRPATWAHQQNTQSNIGQQHGPINRTLRATWAHQQNTQSNKDQQHGPINRTLGATWTSNMGPSTHLRATWAHQQNTQSTNQHYDQSTTHHHPLKLPQCSPSESVLVLSTIKVSS